MKKTVFFLTAALSVLMIFTEINALAILPYLATLFLMYQEVYQKINRAVPITVIAMIMLLLNLFLGLVEDTAAFLDVIVWGMIAFTFKQKE